MIREGQERSFKVKVLSLVDTNQLALRKINFEATLPDGKKVQLFCVATKSSLKTSIRLTILDYLKGLEENGAFLTEGKEFTV